jgi:Mn-dependent DtxR family transcriptional regulator
LPRRLPRARRRRRASRGRRALTRQLHADPRQITETLETLRQHSLVDIADAGTITLSTAGRADYERLVAARRAGLRELLAGWHPDDHSDVMQLVERLSRDLVNEIPPPATAAAA